MEEYTETIIEDTEEPEIIEFFEYSDESIEIYENVLNEVDPTVPEYVKSITKENINVWNEKASIKDMKQYIDENKEDLRGEQGPVGPQGIPGEKGETGERGLQGIQGPRGEVGPQGLAGKDGYTPVKGKDYFDGTNGKDGVDGKTPVKGEDYFTEADKREIVNLVLKELPSSEEVSY